MSLKGGNETWVMLAETPGTGATVIVSIIVNPPDVGSAIPAPTVTA